MAKYKAHLIKQTNNKRICNENIFFVKANYFAFSIRERKGHRLFRKLGPFMTHWNIWILDYSTIPNNCPSMNTTSEIKWRIGVVDYLEYHKNSMIMKWSYFNVDKLILYPVLMQSEIQNKLLWYFIWTCSFCHSLIYSV